MACTNLQLCWLAKQSSSKAGRLQNERERIASRGTLSNEFLLADSKKWTLEYRGSREDGSGAEAEVQCFGSVAKGETVLI
jgi:hypothetical protein